MRDGRRPWPHPRRHPGLGPGSTLRRGGWREALAVPPWPGGPRTKSGVTGERINRIALHLGRRRLAIDQPLPYRRHARRHLGAGPPHGRAGEQACAHPRIQFGIATAPFEDAAYVAGAAVSLGHDPQASRRAPSRRHDDVLCRRLPEGRHRLHRQQQPEGDYRPSARTSRMPTLSMPGLTSENSWRWLKCSQVASIAQRRSIRTPIEALGLNSTRDPKPVRVW